MDVIIVPLDYNEESSSSIVPICIKDADPDGNPIHRGWVEHGVVPVADPLRKIADHVLNDVWRVSEITERAVHALSRKYRGNLGNEPSRRVLSHARWFAADLQVGGRRARRGTEVDLFEARLETLPQQYDLIPDLLARDTVNRLMEALDVEGSHDIREMASMLMWGCAASEFENRFHRSRNTLSQRFYRGVRRVAAASGITW